MYKKISLYIFIAFNFVNAFAADCSLGTDDAPNPASVACMLGRIINLGMMVAGTIFVGLVAYGGYKISMSLGDPKGYAGAKQHWQYAVMGLAIIVGVTGILSIIGRLFGINVLNPNQLMNDFGGAIQSLMDIERGGN